MKDYFKQNSNEKDLIKLWKLTGFQQRRLFNEGELWEDAEDAMMPGAPDANWAFDAIVTVKTDESDTPTSIGKHIASVFTDFTGLPNQKSHFTRQQKFAFSKDLTEDPPAPICKYLRDKDLVELFTNMYSINDKDKLFDDANVDLLEGFFGSIANARRLLE